MKKKILATVLVSTMMCSLLVGFDGMVQMK